MAKTVILGKTGMLGSEVEKVFRESGLKIITPERNILDAQNCTIENILDVINGADYIINCIGIIKPYIHKDNLNEIQRAIEVNGLFPYKLALAAQKAEMRVIQIATDCVFDGIKGGYKEDDKHNASDVYGKTKSLGEIKADNFLNLRCSVIGREQKSYLSLLEWFLNQPKGAKVKGFKNHLWNGITTNIFAKICRGIVLNSAFMPGLQHIVPSDVVSKAEMLHIFAKVFKRDDMQIEDINSETGINRILSTNNKAQNEYLWKISGCEKILSIREMIEELI